MRAREIGLATRRPHGAVRRIAAPLAAAAAIVAAALIAREVDILAILGEHRTGLLVWVESHPATVVGFYLLTYVAVIVLSLPGAFAMTMTGGFLFGLLPGAALSVLASTAGGFVVFLVARTALGEPVRAWLLSRGEAGLFARAERGLRENAIVYLLLLRLIPAVPFTVANLTPAFFGVSSRMFLATTFIGVIPASTILSSVGVGLGEVLDSGERPDLALLAEPHVILPMIGLLLLATLPLVMRRIRRVRRV